MQSCILCLCILTFNTALRTRFSFYYYAVFSLVHFYMLLTTSTMREFLKFHIQHYISKLLRRLPSSTPLLFQLVYCLLIYSAISMRFSFLLLHSAIRSFSIFQLSSLCTERCRNFRMLRASLVCKVPLSVGSSFIKKVS